MELYGIIWNYMALHGIIWNYMGLCGIIWICLPAQRSSLPMVANLPMRDLRGPEGRPAPSVAVVHNPYAFRGYDLVLVLRTPHPDNAPPPMDGTARNMPRRGYIEDIWCRLFF